VFGFNTNQYGNEPSRLQRLVVGIPLLLFTLLATALALDAMIARREAATVGSAIFYSVMLVSSPWLALVAVRLISAKALTKPLLPPVGLIVIGTLFAMGGLWAAAEVVLNHQFALVQGAVAFTALGTAAIALGLRRKRGQSEGEA